MPRRKPARRAQFAASAVHVRKSLRQDCPPGTLYKIITASFELIIPICTRAPKLRKPLLCIRSSSRIKMYNGNSSAAPRILNSVEARWEEEGKGFKCEKRAPSDIDLITLRRSVPASSRKLNKYLHETGIWLTIGIYEIFKSSKRRLLKLCVF